MIMTSQAVSRIFRFFLLLAFVLSIFLVQAPGVTAAPGVDGDQIIAAAGEIPNRYAPVTAISGNDVTVSDINLLDDTAGDYYTNDDITTGDMILIYQTQGATFATFPSPPPNDSTYGEFNYNGAGTYEFASVASVSGNVITVDATNTAPYSCGGINGTYDIATGNVQVIRVPQYTNLTINNGASIVAEDWDGTTGTGGVVSVLVQSVMTVNGSIDVSGQGFRGGVVDNTSNPAGSGTTDFVSNSIGDGAEKGESILGYQSEYDANNGRYGRGAPANGGGGGVSHNSGGGGGANGDNGGTWTGHGLPDTSNSSWDPAWDLDDGSDDGAGDPLPTWFTNGSGGGRGGYSFGFADRDALTEGPGDPDWVGDFRRNVGGYGGRPVSNDPASQLFFGGGGGAGDANDMQSNPGGDGGGLVVVVAFTLNGTGQILANGDSVPDLSGPDYADGNSGGGAGGTVVIGSSSATGVTISANGGNGGDIDDGSGGACLIGGSDGCTLGAGGGGGGGYVHVNTASGSLTASVSGGANGTDFSDYVSEFPPDGTTAGYDGATSTTDFAFPGCGAPTAINLFGMSSSSAASSAAILPVMLLVAVMFTTLFVLRRKPLPIG